MPATFAATSQLSGNSDKHSAFMSNSGLPASSQGGTGLDSSLLLNGQKAVTIVHNGTLYRLQATKLGKLILTK
ncbi:hemin uptake protein HemP [Comamonas composti]|uniref:hemin uptake protein HemP n=1 Tax=Comamonas composti TaxID=408558 RepID=UPI00040452BF|nr:hemin uptake protein HemP [Comamonas composti]